MTFRRRHIHGRRAGTLPVLIAALLATATATAAAPAAHAQQPDASGTGGSEALPGGLDVRPSALAQRPLRIAGNAGAGAAGRTIRVERQRADGGWERIATAVADADGAFVARWLADAPGRYGVRATVEREPSTAVAADSRDLFARVAVFAPAIASWYGPGFFGRETACGIRLTRRTVGVAHKKLPCGTRVEFLHRGRTLVVPVIDRGPYVAGRQWDLTQAAAEQLGVRAVARVGVLPAS